MIYKNTMQYLEKLFTDYVKLVKCAKTTACISVESEVRGQIESICECNPLKLQMPYIIIIFCGACSCMSASIKHIFRIDLLVNAMGKFNVCVRI